MLIYCVLAAFFYAAAKNLVTTAEATVVVMFGIIWNKVRFCSVIVSGYITYNTIAGKIEVEYFMRFWLYQE